MALLVSRDQERPLIGVAALPWHDPASEIVGGGVDVLPQLRMLRANRLGALAEIADLGN